MPRRRWLPLLPLAVAAGGFTAAPVVAKPRPTTRLSILHNLRGCHVWSTTTKPLGATARLTLATGGTVVIRLTDPISFDFAQQEGPVLQLGDSHSVAGTKRTIRFPHRGVYRLRVTSAQTSDELGLQTLGQYNTLTLLVTVE